MLAIDLFSGIGGLSLALHDYVRTALYCEISPHCRNVLAARMKEGRIHRAPIHSDVTTLHLSPDTKPRMIFGGFPCTDVSSIGSQAGIVPGTRSGLFFHIMRLVDENPSVDVVFLENVQNIRSNGMRTVLEELDRRNFDLAWTIKTASSLGAPHERARWFCLAVRRGRDIRWPDIADDVVDRPQSPSPPWGHFKDVPSPLCMVRPGHGYDDPLYDANFIARMSMLGNTVVPCVVRAAFQQLIKTDWTAPSGAWHNLADVTSFEESGVMLGGRIGQTSKTAAYTQYRDTVVYPIHVKYGPFDFTVMSLPTPRAGSTHVTRLTNRCKKDLPCLLVHSTDSIAHLQTVLPPGTLYPDESDSTATRGDNVVSKIALANVQFIEYLMGYPKDWTRVHAEDVVVKPAKQKLNGMELFFKECKAGADDKRKNCERWEAIGSEQRACYSKRAAALKNAC